MRVVDFEGYCWPTVQGEGVLVGMPSVFVRLQGCEFTCSWCDTKGSWDAKAGAERTVDEVVQDVKSYGIRHVVITGGNPFLQAEECTTLAYRLGLTGRHVTVETQGSLFHQELCFAADLLSISPKLHHPRMVADLYRFLVTQRDHGRKRETQIKIVVSTREEVHDANELFKDVKDLWGSAGNPPHFVVQPEYSKGREFLLEVTEYFVSLRRVGLTSAPDVRVLPQAHKLLYSLR
jgi:7-cyano-7-deazaguanosine (preQ0) biosynthesis protein QueE